MNYKFQAVPMSTRHLFPSAAAAATALTDAFFERTEQYKNFEIRPAGVDQWQVSATTRVGSFVHFLGPI